MLHIVKYVLRGGRVLRNRYTAADSEFENSKCPIWYHRSKTRHGIKNNILPKSSSDYDKQFNSL